MDVSIRDTCAACLAVGGTIRVNRDLFGYIYGKIDRDLRIRQHIERIRGSSINISVFLVGHEPGFGGWFTETQALRAQFAIDVMRELVAQAGVGVRRIYWRYIPMDEAGPYMSVDSDGATDLTDAFSGPNDGIDVFWVQDVSDAGGWSNSDGPCDKNADKAGRTGAVQEIEGRGDEMTGILLAHEVAHYLTLTHFGLKTNLMGIDVDGIGCIDTTSRDITSDQADAMLASCWIRDPC
jgi:hypothetical protein